MTLDEIVKWAKLVLLLFASRYSLKLKRHPLDMKWLLLGLPGRKGTDALLVHEGNAKPRALFTAGTRVHSLDIADISFAGRRGRCRAELISKKPRELTKFRRKDRYRRCVLYFKFQGIIKGVTKIYPIKVLNNITRENVCYALR